MSLSTKAWAWAGFTLRERLKKSQETDAFRQQLLNLRVTQEDQATILRDYFKTLCASVCF